MWNPHDPDEVGQTFSLAYLRRAEHEAVVAALTRLRAQVEAERLTDDTGHPTDIGYNQAITDILALIDTALRESRP